MAPVIAGNPDATRVIPVFTGSPFPSPEDVRTLRDLIRERRYDLCLSFGPFVEQGDLAARRQAFISFLTHAPAILLNENHPARINHFSLQQYQFVRALLAHVARPVRAPLFRGVRTTHGDEAIAQASRFAAQVGLSRGCPVIMVNPDSASRFNLPPFALQAALLKRITADTVPDATILLGAGHSVPGIGARLVESLPAALRAKCRVIPASMDLEVYAAVLDFADVFITGDTGPLHLAAARHYARSGDHRFRNRTAVLSLFGATMPRLSGYDSVRPGYLPANQDAPSWCYQAGSPCRNVTCLNKYFKTCSTVRCFEHVDVPGLAATVATYVNGPALPASSSDRLPAALSSS